jgi:hypothetical protein
MTDRDMRNMRPVRQFAGRAHPLTVQQEFVELPGGPRNGGRTLSFVPKPTQDPKDPQPKKIRSNQ